MFRCGGARKTFCGQDREQIVDFRDTNLPERWRTRRLGHAVSRGIRVKTYPYEQIILALKRFFSKKIIDCVE